MRLRDWIGRLRVFRRLRALEALTEMHGRSLVRLACERADSNEVNALALDADRARFDFVIAELAALHRRFGDVPRLVACPACGSALSAAHPRAARYGTEGGGIICCAGCRAFVGDLHRVVRSAADARAEARAAKKARKA